MNNNLEQLSLIVHDVTVAYNNGTIALSNASFALYPGTICGLVGVNGSGKSTLFKAIMGFVTPLKGEIKVNEYSVKSAHKKSLVAYVPQSEDVDWSFPVSVWDVVLMGRYGFMGMLRIPSKKDKRIAMESLEKVGMLEFKDRQIGELSGGQKKRAFLARAIAQQGKIILLDEPFTGVDVKSESAIIDLLKELRNDGHIILVSTHNLGSVPEYCDQVVVINKRIIAFGDTANTFTPANLSLAFGGTLRHVRFDHTDTPGAKNEIFVLTDDESALVVNATGEIEKIASLDQDAQESNTKRVTND